MNPSARLFRLPFQLGALLYDPDPGVALIPGQLMFATSLTLDHRDGDGLLLQHRDLGSGVVTTAGVNYLAADFAGGASDISAFTWHGSGTGATAAAIGDTALVTAAGPARVSGTSTTPGTVNIYQNVGTLAYTTTLAITEWGLFSAVTAGTMWDRRVFSAINVVNGDSIQFTYQLTLTAGG